MRSVGLLIFSGSLCLINSLLILISEEYKVRHRYFDGVGRIKFQPNSRLYSPLGANGDVHSLRSSDHGFRMIERTLFTYISNKLNVRVQSIKQK